MFCSHCGKEIEDGVETCPHCGATLTAPTLKDKLKGNLNPIAVVGLCFSAIAFVFGFILVTCVFVKGGMPAVEFIVMIPAFVGLGIGVYKMFDSRKQPVTKAIAVISALLSAFVILYSFIGYMVTILG